MRKFKSQKNDMSLNVQPTKNKLLKHSTDERSLNYSALASGLKPPGSELKRYRKPHYQSVQTNENLLSNRTNINEEEENARNRDADSSDSSKFIGVPKPTIG